MTPPAAVGETASTAKPSSTAASTGRGSSSTAASTGRGSSSTAASTRREAA